MPPETINDVIAQMDLVIERCMRERSKLGYFAVLYRNVTVRVRDGIAAGRFEDGPRMERLDVVFAHRYLDTINQFWRGEQPTKSWGVAFESARRWSPIILQHMLLGMNAHINLDLAIAAAQVTPENELPALKRDFLEITDLLDEMIQGMQARIEQVSPWFRIINLVGGRTNEQICGFGMKAARDLAWITAEKLAATPHERLAQEIAIRDQVVAILGHAILVPVGIRLKLTLALILLRESRDVPTVMEILQM